MARLKQFCSFFFFLRPDPQLFLTRKPLGCSLNYNICLSPSSLPYGSWLGVSSFHANRAAVFSLKTFSSWAPSSPAFRRRSHSLWIWDSFYAAEAPASPSPGRTTVSVPSSEGRPSLPSPVPAPMRPALLGLGGSGAKHKICRDGKLSNSKIIRLRRWCQRNYV